MIINHNMQALNAHRQMGVNQKNATSSMEKLSSGLRINKAGDDAAGLSISEKMRSQIRGLDQANRNAQDGISLIQTAEGALDETHSILQRVRELATQGANDTNVDADREAIKEEIGQLTKELDRIAETTEFNTKNLLGGSFEGKFQIGANEGQTIDIKIAAMDSKSLGLVSGAEIDASVTVNATDKLKDGTYTISGADVLDKDNNIVGQYATGVITLSGGDTVTLAEEDGTALSNGVKSFTIDGATAKVQLASTGDALSKLAPGEYSISASGNDVFMGDKKVGVLGNGTGGGTMTELTTNDGTVIDLTELGLVAADLAGGDKFTIKGIDVSNADNATGSITTIDKAIETVSKQRSALGAMQNRLEHTINNLGTSSENLTAAESRVRDVDMAKEMMEMSKNNILQQASQAMLAQANQNPQQVLQLLR